MSIPPPPWPDAAGDSAAMLERPSKVLVVDDEHHVARLLEFMLTRVGYQVVIARDGVSALEKVAESVPDAVLLDLFLPKLSGEEVLNRWRSDPALKDLVVVVLSGKTYAPASTAESTQGDRANARVSKPIAPSELLRLLAELGVPPRRSISSGTSSSASSIEGAAS
ncbi:response regulator [Isosphaera pallida]|nr:response regulator [Isosphaera pallida]